MNNHFDVESIPVDALQTHIQSLATLLHASVLDGASVSFILPFSLADAHAFWANKVQPALSNGKRILLTAQHKGEITGCVMLDFDLPPNQPHRGEIVKLLVHPKHRRQGIAQALMIEIEKCATNQNLSLLLLDTANDGAERLYKKLGYIISGRIPKFALNSSGTQLESTVIMFKDLK